VLSLVFVPSFYSIVDSIATRTGRFFSRFVGPKEEDDTPAHGQARALPPQPKPELRLAAE
jgi:hydrophobic/amphiphilic exporter-1 (mainly G- bacteria), HAE1 family